MIKQRIKSTGICFDADALERAIQEEWDAIPLEMINRYIEGLLQVRDELYLNGGEITSH